ncbi:hypothetical protein BT96DRAFT_1013095 [Gymnopus androsaceus JB14]|uniref:Uncharacterized protein n=1 Tax=Gymnopus androsaceus JB14 TaxID=1447944 RepID=A0A6A4II54_9AGAR|nr:hypothetical protein BT96DRAFT_1013095 [Gymnopus androsaceus JB14]
MMTFPLKSTKPPSTCATLFDSPRQLSSILPYFLSHSSDSSNHSAPPQARSLCPILIALIHQLVIGYPSQSLYRQSIHSISGYLLEKSPEAYRWISSLSSSLWTHNFSKLEKLTRPASFASFLGNPSSESLSAQFSGLSISPNSTPNELVRKAFVHVVDVLRIKVRLSAWTVIRASYRELACDANSGTRDWLIRSLALTMGDTTDISLDDWLEEKKIAGHIRPKEGVEGRWIVHKP